LGARIRNQQIERAKARGEKVEGNGAQVCGLERGQ